LAAAFGTATATARRYVTETMALLAAQTPKLRQALRDASKAGHVYVVIDGILIPVHRVAVDRPFYSDLGRCCGVPVERCGVAQRREGHDHDHVRSIVVTIKRRESAGASEALATAWKNNRYR
jgi:hypothetical protein